jgi:hypothetical protein
MKRGLQHRETASEAQPDISQRHDRAAALRTNPDAPENWSLQRLPGPLEKGRRGRSTYNKAGNTGFTIQSPDKAEAGRAEPFPVVEKSKRRPVLAEALKQTEAQRNGAAAAKDLAGGKRRAQRARVIALATVEPCHLRDTQVQDASTAEAAAMPRGLQQAPWSLAQAWQSVGHAPLRRRERLPSHAS